MSHPSNEELAGLHASGLSHADIARRLGVSRQAVHQRLGKVKHRSARAGDKLSEAKVREARRLRSAGWTVTRLADRYSVSQECMSAPLRGRTWAWVDAPLPGPVKTRPASTKLSVSKVRAARMAWGNGARCSDLARKYGVTKRVMLAALRGETWASVS